MIQVYADGVLAYDSRFEEYDLSGLTVTTGVNIGGTAVIVMPQDHPAYNLFVGCKTIVTIYRNGNLRFRGRALYPDDSIYGERKVTCEGELCLLRDSIIRPYSYGVAPGDIFLDIIEKHNSQVEPYKHFIPGQITVESAWAMTEFESEKAESTLDVINKLRKQCGGYIVFAASENGGRVIHWLQSIDRRSTQKIEFGENLLDFSSTGANSTELATGLIPYGAKDKDTGKRLTIESVNNGKDYILAEDAIAVRGTIFATETWDDVTDPWELLEKARAYLDQKKLFITTLTLTALDLSVMDKSIDCFSEGDLVRVVSAPHGVDDDFLLTKMKEDLLIPSKSSITMGMDIQTLTGSGVQEKRKQDSELASIAKRIMNNYSADLEQTAESVKKLEQAMAEKIAELEEKIKQLEG